ncbi:MAG: hypothetical protein WCN87_00600, partial [Chlamydiota bacterium]
MIKLKHKSLITIAGIVWLCIGGGLLSQGLRLIVDKAAFHEFEGRGSSSLLSFFADFSGGFQQAGMILIAIALFVGYFKSRFVLAKTVRKMVLRIRQLPEPSPVYKIYSGAFYIVIAAMMGLGILMRVTGIPTDFRGLIDVTVGSALINGSLL